MKKTTRGVVISDKPLDNQITTLEELGKSIKYKRTSSGLSITKTALLCGISDKTLQSVERGDDCKFSTALKLTKMFGLKLNIIGL
jgi:predicted transcriptional regulator